MHRIETGEKAFEVRWNDRDYQVGDTIQFMENEREDHGCRRFDIRKKIIYTHIGYGVMAGYIILGLGRVEE